MYFWNCLAVSMIQRMLLIWSLVPLPFQNSAWISGISKFMYLQNFEHYFVSIWDECNCAVIWAFLALLFFGIGMKTDLFQSCGHCWVFQVCWHIESSTFTASSFRIHAHFIINFQNYSNQRKVACKCRGWKKSCL